MARKMKQVSLGQRIKRLRENSGMGIETLANETGYTVKFLEGIEGEQAIPPVAVLLTLSRALKVDSGMLLKDEGEDEAAERRTDAVRKRTDRYSYQVLTPETGHKHLKGFLISIDPSSDLAGAGYQHEGEEFHFILKGEVVVKVGENENHLKPGDSLHFNSNIVHTLRNPGDETAELLVILYTP